MMSSDSRTYASICIYGPDLDPDEISAVLGVTPTDRGRRGDVLGRKRAAARGYWILSTRDIGHDPSDAAADGSGPVRRLATWAGLDQQALERLHLRFLVRVFVYWDLQDGNGGPALMPDVLAWLVKIGAELHVDLYESAAP